MMVQFPETKTIKDSIRDAIGQTVTFTIRGSASACPTCSGANLYDSVNEISLDPFCAVCSGMYWITQDTTSGVVAHVRWRCVSPDTNVFLNPMVKTIDDVVVGDKVLSEDGSYHVVNDVVKRRATEIYEIRTLGNEPVKVSGNHPFLASTPIRRWDNGGRYFFEAPKWKTAENLSTDDYVVFPKPKLGDVPKYIDCVNVIDIPTKRWIVSDTSIEMLSNKKRTIVPRFVVLDNSFLEVLGWYFAEGSLGHGTVRFSLNKSEYDIARSIALFLRTRFNSNYNINIVGHSCNLEIYSEYLKKLFVALCGTGLDKRIHPQIFGKGLLSMFKGYCYGDGYIRSDRLSVDSVAKNLVYQWKMILAANGYYLNTYKIRDHQYRMQISGTGYTSLCNLFSWDRKVNKKESDGVFADDNYFYLKVKAVQRKPYHGFLYDLNVDSVHSFVGNGILLHNSGDESDWGIAGETLLGDCSITISVDDLSDSQIVKVKEVIADGRKLEIFRTIERGVPSRDRIRFICREVGKE